MTEPWMIDGFARNRSFHGFFALLAGNSLQESVE
jgi:hypothetical protein